MGGIFAPFQCTFWELARAAFADQCIALLPHCGAVAKCASATDAQKLNSTRTLRSRLVVFALGTNNGNPNVFIRSDVSVTNVVVSKSYTFKHIHTLK